METFAQRAMFLATVAAVCTLISCQKEISTVQNQSDDLVFTAEIATDANKTTVHALTGKVEWEMNDTITITDATLTSVKYVASEILETGFAKFVKASEETKTLGAGPYTAAYGIAPELEQVYTEEAPALPMEAESETTHLRFTVTCGLLELKLREPTEIVKSIYVTGYPEPKGADSTVYTLTCPETGLDITDTVTFYVALPAGTYNKITINANLGHICKNICKKKTTGVGITIATNHITPVSFKRLDFFVQMTEGGPYWTTKNLGAVSPYDCGLYFFLDGSYGERWTPTKSPAAAGGRKSIGYHTTFIDDGDIQNQNAVQMCSTLNITTGYDDGNINPTEALSRSEACRMIQASVAENGGLTQSGGTTVFGLNISNTVNGELHSMFLPASGYLVDGVRQEFGTSGYYLTLCQTTPFWLFTGETFLQDDDLKNASIIDYVESAKCTVRGFYDGDYGKL